MENKLIPTIVLSAVVVILIGSLLIPIIDDYSDDTKVEHNNTGYALTKMTDVSDLTVTYEYSTKELSKDGEVAYTLTSGFVPLVITDKFVMVGSISADNTMINGTDGKATNITNDVSIVFSDGDATVTYGTTERSFTDIGWCFVVDPAGDYGVASKAASVGTVYYNNIDQLYGSNWIDTTSEWFSFNGTNVKVGGETIQASVTEHTVTDAADIFYTTIGGGSTGEYYFTVDNNGTDYDVHPRFYVCPITVEGHSESILANLGLLFVIPVILIAAMIVAVVVVAFKNKY